MRRRHSIGKSILVTKFKISEKKKSRKAELRGDGLEKEEENTEKIKESGCKGSWR